MSGARFLKRNPRYVAEWWAAATGVPRPRDAPAAKRSGTYENQGPECVSERGKPCSHPSSTHLRLLDIALVTAGYSSLGVLTR